MSCALPRRREPGTTLGARAGAHAPELPAGGARIDDGTAGFAGAQAEGENLGLLAGLLDGHWRLDVRQSVAAAAQVLCELG